MRILAVDDDPIILELISVILESEDDQELLTASSAAEALEILDNPDTPQIDCFLLDIQMPVMNGIDLCAAIRQRPGHRTTPIVMLTAMTEKRYMDGAFIAGATDYITKPFDIADMQRRLRTAAIRNIAMTHANATAGSADTSRGSGLLSPIPIYDVDNVIDYFAFENYARKLPKQALFTSLAIGFQIRRAAEFHAACDSFTFESLVCDVAEAISDCLRDHSFVMSYAGNGTFLCLIEDGRLPDRAGLVSRINLTIQQMDLAYGPGCPVNLQVSAGEYVRLVGRNPDGISEALVHAQSSADAVARARDEKVDEIWYAGVVAE